MSEMSDKELVDILVNDAMCVGTEVCEMQAEDYSDTPTFGAMVYRKAEVKKRFQELRAEIVRLRDAIANAASAPGKDWLKEQLELAKALEK